jgi:prolyl oligopeptidase
LQKEDHVTRLAFDGDDVYMKTYNDAPNNKIIKSNLNHFSVANAKTIISEGNDHIIYLDRSKDYLFITYNDGINSTAKQYNLHTGQLAPVNLPLTGTGVLVPYDIQSNDGLILLTSWKQPVTLYDYNADIGEINESAFNIRADYPGINDIEVVETEVKAMTVPWFRYLLFTIKR